MATRNELINGALQLIGEYSPGETVSSDDLDVAADFLNDVVSSLVTDGFHLWKQEQISFTTVASQGSYTVGATGDVSGSRPLHVRQAWIRDSSNNDTDLVLLTRNEYFLLGDKTIEGTTNQLYMQATIPNSTVYLYPVPNDANHTIYMDCDVKIDTFTGASDDMDFPPEWALFLKYALAVELATVFVIPDNIFARIFARYNKLYDDMLAHDSEQLKIHFKPSSQFRWQNPRRR